MPSEPIGQITGRCYCGHSTFASEIGPSVVTYCHCANCRRSSGAPVAAFAAFEDSRISFSPDTNAPISVNPGVKRWYCPVCNSQLKASYDYLPGMVYVPLGIIDQADALPPELHSHFDHCLSWLDIKDDLPRQTGSARDALNAKSTKGSKD